MVGESFSEIFFGNSMAIGFTVPDGHRGRVAATLQAAAAAQPDLVFLRRPGGDDHHRGIAWALPDSLCRHRRATHSGRSAGMPTGLLLERYDEVRAVAGRLPYVTGNFIS